MSNTRAFCWSLVMSLGVCSMAYAARDDGLWWAIPATFFIWLAVRGITREPKP